MTKLCHFEIPAKDLAKSKEFYEGLFGWNIELMTEMNYAMINIEDEIGGGLALGPQPSGDAGITLFFEVEDIPSALAKAAEIGGKKLKDKTPIGGDFGFFGVFEDVAGNQVGLWSKS